MHLYEDLAALERSPKYTLGVTARERVINVQNKRKGIQARRGDGTFGEIIPGETPIVDLGYKVARGPVATIEIGVEVKILAKAMIKQIDRVTGDLTKQVGQFKHRSGSCEPICVGIVGINSADVTTGYEGDRRYRTDGTKHKHPIQEAAEAQRRLQANAAPAYDEFVVLRYKATNEPSYPFEWVDYKDAIQEYGSVLTRISRNYEKRF
ncbi:MAG: hypothetical protein M3Y07_15465 [Acidobacteriota bacterium]|nr:hypothetical protein [Acidobacteriota bacterium]